MYFIFIFLNFAVNFFNILHPTSYHHKSNKKRESFDNEKRETIIYFDLLHIQIIVSQLKP